MAFSRILASLVPALLGSLPTPSNGALLPAAPLGRPPVCEASAAVVAPWDEGTLLVGDNEVEDRLFAYSCVAGGPCDGQTELSLPGGPIEDIEALAVVGDVLVVVGSHGRNGRCERRPGGRQILWLRWNGSESALEEDHRIETEPAWAEAMARPTSCLERLFVSPAPAGAAAFCRSLAAMESSAEGPGCLSFDVEGAAAIVDDSGEARLWLGLRQPRHERRPTLLRVSALGPELRFDAVVTLDTDDRAIRSLASRILPGGGTELWAILGPGAPDYDHSRLWHAPAEPFASGRTVLGVIEEDRLPPNSEGLVVGADHAIVVTDGTDGNGSTCEEPAGQLVVPLARTP